MKAESGNGTRLNHRELTEKKLSLYLDNPALPDPDLIIRTSGEMRISNFLLWESPYSELYFSSKCWPEWEGRDLLEALECYRRRERRFGCT